MARRPDQTTSYIERKNPLREAVWCFHSISFRCFVSLVLCDLSNTLELSRQGSVDDLERYVTVSRRHEHRHG